MALNEKRIFPVLRFTRVTRETRFAPKIYKI